MPVENKTYIGGGKEGVQLNGTANKADVLENKTFYNRSPNKLTGTMPNRGSVVAVINPGDSYSIPNGYHTGNGTITATSITPADFTGTASSSSRTISGLTANTWYAFACFNGRGTNTIRYSSGLTNVRQIGTTTTTMNISTGVSSDVGYVLCCIGKTTGTSVTFSCSYDSNIRIRAEKIGSFTGSSGSGDVYTGDYTVIPKADEQTILATSGKLMAGDVTVTEVPYYETSNLSGGNTVYIAEEVE